jgi:hypothetical protein
MDLVDFWNKTSDVLCISGCSRKGAQESKVIISNEHSLRRGIAAGQIGKGPPTPSGDMSFDKYVPPSLALPGASMRCARNVVANLCYHEHHRARRVT